MTYWHSLAIAVTAALATFALFVVWIANDPLTTSALCENRIFPDIR
jgi:hypothetical protein